MNVYMDDDLYELYSTGNNRKYKDNSHYGNKK